MTRFDVILGANSQKKEKNKLKLILDAGDNILESIKKGMLEHKVPRAEVVRISGGIEKGIIEADGQKQGVEEIGVLSAKGKFSVSGDDLWGSMEVFTSSKNPLKGKLLKGTAQDGLEIQLEY